MSDGPVARAGRSLARPRARAAFPLFAQPPPRAWNRAAASIYRLASAFSRSTTADRRCRSASSTASSLTPARPEALDRDPVGVLGPRRLLGPRGQRPSVRLQCPQHVRDVLQGLEHGLPIRRQRLLVRRLGRPLARLQLAAAEQRLQEVDADVPHVDPAAQDVADVELARRESAGDDELGIEVGGRDPDVRARLVQERLAGADVGALADELRRAAAAAAPPAGAARRSSPARSRAVAGGSPRSTAS